MNEKWRSCAVQRYTGHSWQTVLKWIREGRFPPHDLRIGNVRYWSRVAVEEAMKRLPRKLQPSGNTPDAEGILHVAS